MPNPTINSKTVGNQIKHHSFRSLRAPLRLLTHSTAAVGLCPQHRRSHSRTITVFVFFFFFSASICVFLYMVLLFFLIARHSQDCSLAQLRLSGHVHITAGVVPHEPPQKPCLHEAPCHPTLLPYVADQVPMVVATQLA